MTPRCLPLGHVRGVTQQVLAGGTVLGQVQRNGGTVEKGALSGDTGRPVPGLGRLTGLCLPARLAALVACGLPWRREGRQPAGLEERQAGGGIDVDLLHHRRAGSRVGAPYGDVAGQDALAGGQDGQPAVGAGQGVRPALRVGRAVTALGQLGLHLPHCAVHSRADRQRRLVGVDVEGGEVGAGSAGDGPLAVSVRHPDHVLGAQDRDSAVLLIQAHRLGTVGVSGDDVGAQIPLGRKNPIAVLVPGQMGPGRRRGWE